jgi:di/tricarboxylate transporter
MFFCYLLICEKVPFEYIILFCIAISFGVALKVVGKITSSTLLLILGGSILPTAFLLYGIGAKKTKWGKFKFKKKLILATIFLVFLGK